MSYIDGYVLAVPRKKLKAYAAMAKDGGKIWRKHGALDAAPGDAGAMTICSF